MIVVVGKGSVPVDGCAAVVGATLKFPDRAFVGQLALQKRGNELQPHERQPDHDRAFGEMRRKLIAASILTERARAERARIRRCACSSIHTICPPASIAATPDDPRAWLALGSIEHVAPDSR